MRTGKRTNPTYSKVYLRDIKNLPSIDEVEIITTALLPSEKVGKIDCQDKRNKCNGFGYLPMQELSTKTISGEKAQNLARLWRALEPGGGAGCFAPAYQLRFKRQNRIVLITNVCFHCCNVTLADASINSICGNESIREFKKMVMESLPSPTSNEKEK